MAETKRQIEQEPAYRLGTAIDLLQCVLGTDKISQESPQGKIWVKRHIKGWIKNFLKKEGY